MTILKRVKGELIESSECLLALQQFTWIIIKLFSFPEVCTVCIVHLKMAPIRQPSFVHTQYFYGKLFILWDCILSNFLQLLCTGCAFIINCTQIICCWLAVVHRMAGWMYCVLCPHSLPSPPPGVMCITYKPLELLGRLIHYKDTIYMLNNP